MQADPILELKAITKHYPGTTAVDGVDLTIQRGEIHGLVGENGAGKSTLIKILSGAVTASAGQITFTFFWPEAGRWEGKDFRVTVACPGARPR